MPNSNSSSPSTVSTTQTAHHLLCFRNSNSGSPSTLFPQLKTAVVHHLLCFHDSNTPPSTLFPRRGRLENERPCPSPPQTAVHHLLCKHKFRPVLSLNMKQISQVVGRNGTQLSVSPSPPIIFLLIVYAAWDGWLLGTQRTHHHLLYLTGETPGGILGAVARGDGDRGDGALRPLPGRDGVFRVRYGVSQQVRGCCWSPLGPCGNQEFKDGTPPTQ